MVFKVNLQNKNFSKNQTRLHQQLKEIYRNELNGQEEVTLTIDDSVYRVDVISQDNSIVCEIHRSNFDKRFSKKIQALLSIPKIYLIIVCPLVSAQKVFRMDKESVINTSYYKKPYALYSLFDLLVRIKTPLIENRMEFRVHLISEIVTKQFQGFFGRTLRRRYKTVDRELNSIEKTRVFKNRNDFIELLPSNLPPKFTRKELGQALRLPKISERSVQRLAGRMTYSLWRLGILERIGKQKQAYLYEYSTIKRDD